MEGEEKPQGNNPDGLYDCHGFTLLGLLFAIAIMGILAAIAVPEWIQFERDAALSSSAASLSAAETALFRCGAQGTGATISARYQQGASTTLMVQNGNNGFCWTGNLQEGANPLIGGKQLVCTSVTATGLTSATLSCPAPQSGLWSVQYAGLTASVP